MIARKPLRPYVFLGGGLAQVVTLLAIGTALWLAYVPWRWGRLREEVRARFPSVPWITPEDFANWRSLPVEQPVLLDARSEAEYNTSYIPGARRAPVNPSQLGVDPKSDVPIVVYCAVGFDSAPGMNGSPSNGFGSTMPDVGRFIGFISR